jgi:2-C-methyl-D-erythritol 4-phosphate cytidylyltransferase
MQQYAIIVAGGTGTRMKNALPKQFLPLHGKPLMYYCIDAFVKTFPDIKLILVLHKNYITNMHSVLQHFADRIDAQIVEGGDTRYQSVQHGLAVVPIDNESIVYVHDAARPFINETLLVRLQTHCIEKGNAIPGILINDSLRKANADGASQAIDRTNMYAVQTPQVFKSSILQKYFAAPYQAMFTDEATVCELQGEKIFVVDGLEQNIKITTPHQLEQAHWMMQMLQN